MSIEDKANEILDIMNETRTMVSGIGDNISRIKANIANAYTELEGKGAVMPSSLNSDNLASTVRTVIEQENLDAPLNEQDILISQIQSALEGKAAGSGSGSGSTSFETCTIVINWEREDYNMLDMKFGMMTLNNQGELSPNIQGETFDTDPSSPMYLATKTFENVVCGTIFVIWYQTYNGEYADAWPVADQTYLVETTMFDNGFMTAFVTPPTQGTYTIPIL